MPISPPVFQPAPRPTSPLKAATRSFLAALPLLLPAAQVMAQADHQPAVIPLPALAVTASKQGTTTFDTPASASVVDERTLDEGRLQGLGEIAQRQPNVYLTGFTGSTPQLTIRGLGFSDDESDSASTSVLVDGVPVYGLVLGTLFDLEQVEILRGPQSTLYGQNSMGGLVALRSKDPGFVHGGQAEVDYGTGNRRRLTMSGDLPLSDRTALRVTLGGEDADGFIDNRRLGSDDTAGWSSRFGRVKLLHKDEAGGEWRLGIHRLRSRGGNDFFATEALARDHDSTANEGGTNAIAYTLVTGDYRRRFAGGTELVVTLGGSDMDWNYWLPTSIFGGKSGFDMAGRQYSGEARLSGKEGRFDWLAGVFASHSRRTSPYLFDLGPVYSSATTAKVTGDTAAVFGEAGWRFLPAWRAAAALRLEHNRRRMDWTVAQGGMFDSNGDGMSDMAFASRTALDGLKTRDTVALPRVTLEYQPNDRHFGYLTLARGYKASGFNLYATDPAAAGAAYDPEYGNHVEIGYRLRDGKGVWEVGASLFHTALRDQQVVVIDAGGQSMTTNAGKSHSQGVELTAALRPFEQLQLRGFAAFVEAEYDRYVKGGVDYAGVQFANTPRHSFGLSADWTPTDKWSAGLAVTRQGSSNLYPNSAARNRAYTLVDAHVSYSRDAWTLGVYGKNLGDAEYFTRGMSNGFVVAGAPRTVGVRAAARF